MILLNLLQAFQQPVPLDQPEDEIVVVAQRMTRVRWSYDAKDGRLLRCTIKRVSGSATVDAMVCEASRQCAAENPTVGDRRLAPCIKDRVRTLYATWRAEKLAARASAAQAPRQP